MWRPAAVARKRATSTGRRVSMSSRRGLYRGDFMADDPYEDWAALTRERLRLAHLDALGRLSKLYFNAGHYTVCASLCQRIIE